MKKTTQAEFIARATEIHHGKYDYSKSIYKRAHAKLIIICSEHGEFEQTAHNHLAGKGCKKCASKTASENYAKTTEQYIQQLREKHGDRYDYSKIQYKNAWADVTLICHRHGEIVRAARVFLKSGCPLCGIQQRAQSKTRSTEEFIQLSKEVHGSRYSYELTTYELGTENVEIICDIHGAFEIVANYHLRGSGCPTCLEEAGKSPRLRTTKEFIRKAVSVHGNNYLYENTIYSGRGKKITITCPQHGDFSCFAGNHLKGHGCKKCAGYGRTTEEFIAASKRIHGNKYDYSKTRFTKVDAKVKITCRVHGDFLQRAQGHISGKGCKGCQRDEWRLSKEEFIENSRIVHGKKYNYDYVEYIDNKSLIEIICPKHGSFTQKPSTHMSGSACPDCSHEARRLTKEDFIQRSIAIHGLKYAYEDVQYESFETPVILTCPHHGNFKQKPSQHLRGSGCPQCASFGHYNISSLVKGAYDTDRNAMLFLYVAHQTDGHNEDFLNIGLSKYGYHRRYSGLTCYSALNDPDTVYLPRPLAVFLEQLILRETRELHYTPKVAFAGGATECRLISAENTIYDLVADFAFDPTVFLRHPLISEQLEIPNDERRISELTSLFDELSEMIVT